jgi:uncharacterized protein DUF2752
MKNTRSQKIQSFPCRNTVKSNQEGRKASIILKTVFSGIILFSIVFCTVIYTFPPGYDSIYPPCFFHRITGLHCPGCGLTRSVHHLLHGRILTALRYNVLIVLISFLVLWTFVAMLKYILYDKKLIIPYMPEKYTWIIIIFIMSFLILRNITLFPFIYLSPP